MKFIFILLVFLFYLGCKNADWPCESPNAGICNVNTNYPDWINTGSYFTINPTDSLIILRINSVDHNCNITEIQFSKISLIDTTYFDIHNIHFIEFDGNDGDVGRYKLVKSNFVNFLDLNSWDKFNKVLKGSFQLTFVPDSSLLPKVHDTIRFYNSSFEAALIKK